MTLELVPVMKVNDVPLSHSFLLSAHVLCLTLYSLPASVVHLYTVHPFLSNLHLRFFWYIFLSLPSFFVHLSVALPL